MANIFKKQKGAALIYLIIFIGLFVAIMLPIVGNLLSKFQLMRLAIAREQAFQIAEAGISYYQWHLISFPDDYKDGEETSGPYEHDYIDYDISGTKVIGKFSLTITPPGLGSSNVIVQSTGWTTDNPNVTRTITANFGIPSLANYSLLTHSWIYAWDSEAYNGPVHSDGGIRFEGTAQSTVTSSLSGTYTSDCNQEYPEHNQYYCTYTATRDAIWALGSNKAQSSVYWNNPTTTADFTGIASSFAEIAEASTITGNLALPNYSMGYSLVFNSAGTVSVYKTLRTTNSGSRFSLTQAISGGTDTALGYISGGTDYSSGICYNSNCNNCGTNGRCFQYTQTIPSDGMVISAQNNLWVEGTVKGRVTVATSSTSATNMNPNSSGTTSNLIPNIYIPGNIRYSTNESGTGEDADTLGLMVQGNIIVTENAPDNTYIDAALLAQNGFVGYPICYPSGDRLKNNLYVFGSMIMHGSWWFNFTNRCGSSITDGYPNPNFVWDTNLLYYPPPFFPDSSVGAGLELIKWTTN